MNRANTSPVPSVRKAGCENNGKELENYYFEATRSDSASFLLSNVFIDISKTSAVTLVLLCLMFYLVYSI